MTAAAAFVIGLGCKVAGEREKEKRLTRADSFLVVTLSWVVFSVIGAIPYIFIAGMDVHAAFFEAMSGFTTTGATCISDVDAMPKGLLFWRSLTHWIGGLGIVVFSFALIPSYDMRSSNVFSAEVTGLGVDKLRPKIGDTARRLLLIYLFLTAVCALCYWLGPMDTYDSVCHAMSTIATGGFSTHTASIGYFHSAYIEYVCCFFMLLSGVNFSLFYYAVSVVLLRCGVTRRPRRSSALWAFRCCSSSCSLCLPRQTAVRRNSCRMDWRRHSARRSSMCRPS